MTYLTMPPMARILFRASITSCLAAFGFHLPAQAQKPTSDVLERGKNDITALIDADERKSPFCADYVGKVVTVTGYDALMQSLPSVTGKGEFEKTVEYDARLAALATRATSGPIVVALPTDRKYLHYLADSEFMMVSAGAFGAGRFSAEIEAEIASSRLIPESVKKGIPIPHSESERVLRSYNAQNNFGVSVRVSDIDRQSNAIYVDTLRLFSFTKDDMSPVLGISVPAPQASRLKQTIRVALVVQPKSPYVFRTSRDGLAATINEPVHYNDRVSAIYVEAKCGLALDGQSRVLASIDAGD